MNIMFAGDSSDQLKERKAVRETNVEDTIRSVQEPITGPGHKEESVPVKDKGGGDDDDKKTLAQQVADGKYGLIQSELFPKQPRRPGIISYEVNPEVPKDNVNNLGGLQPEEIWLAENHLLVLAGGGFSHKDAAQPVWPAIDNYKAPPRQVKIPPNPKVPPPFPVQLKPGGPIEFIKNENGTGGPPPFFPPPDSQFPPSFNASFPYPPAGYNQGNFTVGNGPYLPPPFPFYPPPPNGSFLPPPGFLPPIPPGAAFLPPPGNLTDQFDEDDPSIYYPPPYDFYYPKDNSSLVPPGPLVPGIVLPPPPDFFALYKNTTASKSRRPISRLPPKSKSPARKPTKHKNVQIITSTEDPYSGVTVRPYIGNVNIGTTQPPVIYSTYSPQVTTEVYTRRPTVKTTTPSFINKIPPKTIIHALPPNAVVKGWVPIPAPRPYYITRPQKPHRKGTTSTTLPPDYNSITPPEDQGYIYKVPDYELSVNSWLYPNKSKTQYFNGVIESPKQNDYYDTIYSNKEHYYSSTQSPSIYNDQTKLKSFLYPTKSPLTSTSSPLQLYQSPENRGKSLKTYYFYEEPHISEGKLTDTESLAYPTTSSQLRYRERDPHTITEEVYSAAKQQVQDQFKPSPLDYFFSQGEYIDISAPKASTESPLKYYYIPQDSSYPYSSGRQSTPRPPTSTKPPVYEYSFSIPGYGAVDPPKVGEYQATARPYDQQFYTTPGPTTTPTPAYKSSHQDQSQHFTTQSTQSQYYTTPRPQTENPYHAFFTHHDADLIDDITKKYFTTFGQKLNKDSLTDEGLTTPLPPVDNVPAKSYYPQSTPRPEYYQPNHPRTKYVQNSAPLVGPGYYNTPPPGPVYSQYYDQRQHSSLTATQKPISLGSDILVNYKEPLPPLNPDAEFIDPSTPGLAKPNQSFISYRLPGNGGGHFFFLTPQVVQQSQQYSDYLYKRSARGSQTQRRRKTHSSTT